MADAEAQFRETERTLDAAVQAARPFLENLGLSIQDRSVRSYHYKADRLAWFQIFERKWDVGLETVLVQIFVTHMEPVKTGAADHVAIASRVQRFRQGKESALDKRSERSVPIKELLAVGIGPTVAQELERGAAIAGQAL
jgi:hypothetical protein